MKNIRYITCGILAGVLMLTSCQHDETITDPPGSDGYAEVSFSMQLPGSYAPGTRALSDNDENEVRTVEVLVFDHATDNFLYSAYADDITGTGNTRQFTVTLAKGDNLDVVLLANSRVWIEECFGGVIPTTKTRTEIEQELIATVPTGWPTRPTSSSYRPIPMYGEKRNVSIDENTTFTGSANRISLSRMLARIDVTIAAAIRSDFKLSAVHLYNPYGKGRLIPDQSPTVWDAAADRALAPSLLPGWTSIGSSLPYGGTAVSTAGIAREIYTFEAPAGTTAAHPSNTFLVLGGTYKGVAGFYRVDFANDGALGPDYLPLLRNHKYTVNVGAITGPGYTTAALAAAALPMNIEAGVVVRTDHDLSHYVYDGQYYLGTDAREVELWSTAATETIRVNTDYPGSPTSWTVASVTDAATNAAPTWLTTGTQTDNGAGATGTLEYTVTDNTGGTDRTARIVLKAGVLETTVTVRQLSWYLTYAGVTPTGTIPAAGETRKVIMIGTSAAIPVRAYDVTNDTPIATATIPAGSGNREGEVNVSDYTGPAGISRYPVVRTVSFQYQNPSTGDWNDIRNEDQNSYWLNVFSNHNHGTEITGGGESFTVEALGEYPGEVLLRAFDGTDDISGYLTAHINAGTVPTTGTVHVSNNGTGSERTVRLQYSIDGGSTWKDMSTGKQPKGNIVLSTGRIVARNDALSEGLTGAAAMDWVTAMGISSIYLSQYYYTSYGGGNALNATYSPDLPSGCGGYSEPTYPIGIWRLPTQAELSEMYQLRASIGNLSLAYWYHSSAEYAPAGSAGVYMLDGRITGNNNSKPFSSGSARCVREPD